MNDGDPDNPVRTEASRRHCLGFCIEHLGCDSRDDVFEVNSATMQFGRRGTIHEFPFKDIPDAEDVGRKARVITISAFVDGDDYILRRNDLLKAIEDFDTPGTLVMPTLGSIRVKPTEDCSTTFNNRLGGVETFNLKFVEVLLTNQMPEVHVS